MTNDGGDVCGGTMSNDMFATSCDPGYGQLGVKLTAPTLVEQAEMFGYDSRPPIDLPDSWVATPSVPAASTLTPPNQEELADTAIGQLNDQASALSNAMVAAGIADDGTIMTPHVMSEIVDEEGDGRAAVSAGSLEAGGLARHGGTGDRADEVRRDRSSWNSGPRGLPRRT